MRGVCVCCGAVCDGVTEMYCESGECVSLTHICDGNIDCRDASDEHNCHLSTTIPGQPLS